MCDILLDRLSGIRFYLPQLFQRFQFETDGFTVITEKLFIKREYLGNFLTCFRPACPGCYPSLKRHAIKTLNERFREPIFQNQCSNPLQ
jgi:hypothetical protein